MGICSGTATTRYPSQSLVSLAETPAADILGDIRECWVQTLPPEAGDLWMWLRTNDQATKLHLLSYLVAESLDAVQVKGAEPKQGADDLHAALGLNMADYWTATAEAISRASRNRR